MTVIERPSLEDLWDAAQTPGTSRKQWWWLLGNGVTVKARFAGSHYRLDEVVDATVSLDGANVRGCVALGDIVRVAFVNGGDPPWQPAVVGEQLVRDRELVES